MAKVSTKSQLKHEILYFIFLLLVYCVIVACNVTRNEICNQELLVNAILALESRWLKTVVVGDVFNAYRETLGVY
jgi:hypothetical protein